MRLCRILGTKLLPMKDNTYFTGLDIGSHAIRAVVLQSVEGRDLQVISHAEAKSQGVSRGSVTSIDDAVTVLSQVLETAERITGQPITRATVGISGTHITTQESRGVIAVSRADGEVKEDDVDRAVEAAQAVASPPNHEILHVIPLYFSVDSDIKVKDPVGMSGVRLEAVVQIVHGLSAEIKNITKTVYRTGLDVDDLVVSPLACSEAVLSAHQKELGVALVNIGATTTSVAVYEDGNLLHASIIPIGSAHITSDLAIGLRTSINTAEEVKINVGGVSREKLSSKDEVDLSVFSGEESERVSFNQIHKIIEARLEEIFDHVNNKLSQVGRAGRLPAGIMLTGGGAKLPGIVAYAKNHFKLPASVGYPRPLDTSLEKSTLLEYSTAIGLALWDREWRQSSGGGKSLPGSVGITRAIGGLTNKIRDMFG